MTVELIEDKQKWDKFVDESPYATLSHKWDFLKIAEKHSGYKLYTYGYYKGDILRGIYPLFFKKINGLKMVYSPPPRRGMFNLGFVVSGEYDNIKQSKKESFLNSFLGEMEDEIQKYSPDYTLIYTIPNFTDMRFFNWNNYNIMPKYTYVVDLNPPLEEIWNNLHKDVKRCVKLSSGYGLELHMNDDISIFHERQERRYREKEVNFSIDSEYLEEVFKAYPDNIKAYYVHNDLGEVVTGMISQEYKEKFMVWMGIARAKEHANEFLIWKTIEKARSEGFRRFEIAGADEKHLNQFKSRFSPSLETWCRISKMSLLGKASRYFVDLYNRTISQKRIFSDMTFAIINIFNSLHSLFELFSENSCILCT